MEQPYSYLKKHKKRESKKMALAKPEWLAENDLQTMYYDGRAKVRYVVKEAAQ